MTQAGIALNETFVKLVYGMIMNVVIATEW